MSMDRSSVTRQYLSSDSIGRVTVATGVAESDPRFETDAVDTGCLPYLLVAHTLKRERLP